MGVDVQLYVEAPESDLTDEYIAAFDSRCLLGDVPDEPSLEFHKGYGKPELKEYGWAPDRIQVNTLFRYYGLNNYKVRNWPEIKKGIRALQYLFPKCVVCYGGDGLEYSEPITEKLIAELDAQYAAEEEY